MAMVGGDKFCGLTKCPLLFLAKLDHESTGMADWIFSRPLALRLLHLPPGRSERPIPPSLPPALADQLARTGSGVSVAGSEELEVGDGYRAERIELAASVDQVAEPSRIVIEYYQVDHERSPVILLLPMAGGRYNIERKFARYFAQRGFAVVLAYRTKTSREPRIEAIDLWVKQSVEDNRQALDSIEGRAELDSNRVALFGISMGGIKGALLAAVDHRIKAAVLGLAGGDLPYILTHTAEPKISRQREEFMREKGMTPAQLQAELESVIRWDPKFVAPHSSPARVFGVGRVRHDCAVQERLGVAPRPRQTRNARSAPPDITPPRCASLTSNGRVCDSSAGI